MKKAHSIIEVSLLICFVAVIAITSLAIYNNQNTRLANMTKSNVKSVSLAKMDNAKPSDKVPYSAAETAGNNALTALKMTSDQFKSGISNVTYEDLQKASASGSSNIFDLTNALISELKLGYAPVSAENVTEETLSTMIGVLNAAAAVPDTSNAKTTADNFVDEFESLLD